MTDKETPPVSPKEPTVPEVAAETTAEDLPKHPFGAVDAEGNVWVIDEDERRVVGAYPDGLPDDPYALYVRRFQDLEATVNLFEARLPTLPPKDLDQTLSSLRTALVSPSAVGDLGLLRRRVDGLASRVATRKEEIQHERKAARGRALEDRTAIVVEAEEIAAQPPERTQWKASGQRLRDLLDAWKTQQRRGPRLEKSVEDGLWKRFSAARTLFDRNRRQFFSSLAAKQSEAKAAKEKLIAEAEALQDSTDWRATSAAYRNLMDQWKASGRASRKDDDALWARFRAAQQVFFDSRRDHERKVDEQYSENLEAKEALAAEAEALLPVKDIEATKNSLRKIQDQWEEVGHVPARALNRIEGRLRAVERALREAETKEWERTDPETQARAQGMLDQLEASIAELEETLAAAEAAGDAKLARETKNALDVKKMWLEQVQQTIE